MAEGVWGVVERLSLSKVSGRVHGVAIWPTQGLSFPPFHWSPLQSRQPRAFLGTLPKSTFPGVLAQPFPLQPRFPRVYPEQAVLPPSWFLESEFGI